MAYFDDTKSCVIAVAAAGTPSKQLYCISDEERSAILQTRAELGVSLSWLADDRLEVALWAKQPVRRGVHYEPIRQFAIDVKTLESTPTSRSDLDLLPSLLDHPRVDPYGRRLDTNSVNGHAVVTLMDINGNSRVLLDVQGEFDTYHLKPAFFSPDYSFVLSDDGRILISTLGQEPVTMRLTAERESDFSGLAWFAVTELDLL